MYKKVYTKSYTVTSFDKSFDSFTSYHLKLVTRNFKFRGILITTLSRYIFKLQRFDRHKKLNKNTIKAWITDLCKKWLKIRPSKFHVSTFLGKRFHAIKTEFIIPLFPEIGGLVPGWKVTGLLVPVTGGLVPGWKVINGLGAWVTLGDGVGIMERSHVAFWQHGFIRSLVYVQ